MMNIERANGISLWRQIHDQLKAEILSGTIKPGDKLSTEKALSIRFSVNRHTIRRAIASLAKNGLVIARQGYGTFVPETIIDYAIKKRTRFSEVVSAQSRVPKTKLVNSEIMVSTATIAKALGIRKGAKVVRIRTIGEADGRPLNLADHYFTASRFTGLRKAFDETDSISKALSTFGIDDFSRKTTRVTAVVATIEEAELLAQPIARPILLAESINVTPDGKPLEYGRTLFAGDRVQMVFET